MMLLIVLIAVAVLGAAAVAATGRFGAMPNDPVRDRYQPTLPQRPLQPEDLAGLRFDVAARGYNMQQVDEFVARVYHELGQRRSLPAPTVPATGQREVQAWAQE